MWAIRHYTYAHKNNWLIFSLSKSEVRPLHHLYTSITGAICINGAIVQVSIKMILILLTFFVALIGYAFYKLSANNAQYFEERNLKYAGLLSGGGLFGVILGVSDFLEATKRTYNAFPNEP